MVIFKWTYKMLKEKGFRLRLVSAAFRKHMHWSEFIGGDVMISLPTSGSYATTHRMWIRR